MYKRQDIEQEAANKEKEKEAFKICKEKILKHGLEMKLIDAEYTFDNNKVLFYFTADGRIDFREPVSYTHLIRTVKRCHNRREAQSRIMSLRLWMKHILNLRRELYLNKRRQLRCTG